MEKRKTGFKLIIMAVFLAAFIISLYFLAIYPAIKDGAQQRKLAERYENAYNLVGTIFGPEGISVYSYDEYLNMQKGESSGDEDNYLPLVKPVIMPDYELGYVIQPYDIQQFEEQADALRYSGSVQFIEPESLVGRQSQYYDFCLKDESLTPYYQRLKVNARNDIPFVRLVCDYNSGTVLSASIIFRHRAGGEEGSMYWAAGTPREQVINTIVAIYESRPELFVDYVAPSPEPSASFEPADGQPQTQAPAETTLPPTDSPEPTTSVEAETPAQ